MKIKIIIRICDCGEKLLKKNNHVEEIEIRIGKKKKIIQQVPLVLIFNIPIPNSYQYRNNVLEKSWHILHLNNTGLQAKCFRNKSSEIFVGLGH